MPLSDVLNDKITNSIQKTTRLYEQMATERDELLSLMGLTEHEWAIVRTRAVHTCPQQFLSQRLIALQGVCRRKSSVAERSIPIDPDTSVRFSLMEVDD